MFIDAVLVDLIGRIYEAAIGAEDWELALGRLSHIVDGRMTTLHRFQPQRCRPAMGDPEQPPAVSRPAGLPPIQLPVGAVVVDGVPAADQAGAGAAFYREALRPRGFLTGFYRLGLDRCRLAPVLTVCRPRRTAGWGERQSAILRIVAPRFDRALAVERRRGRAAAEWAAGVLPPAPASLTQRERDCLLLVARGASTKEAARRLGLSIHTVEGHIKSVNRKLQATSRTGAVATALALGLLDR
jgi:DNA-binding CsgD family transcriptional regulator